MKLAVNNPNLSVILPVGCNAKCSFCYWKQDNGLTVDRFRFVSNTLPKIFDQCSITGGEPTLLFELDEYLKVAKSRFSKVVLNTNGYRLRHDHILIVDHVNISRHHYDDIINRKIFNCDSIPSGDSLKDLCRAGDVTLNCVLDDGFSDMLFIDKYILFAKECGAKVAFRKYFNNLNILSDVDKDSTLLSYHSCGACLHRRHIIHGVDVTFKYSVNETYEYVNGIYELILQSNGDLTFDWAGKHKLTYKEV